MPLVRGSIGHVGLAHLYARVKAMQEGADPHAYHTASDAMALVAAKYGDLGEDLLGPVTALLRAYIAWNSGQGPQIRAVEEALETVFLGRRYTARADLVVVDRSGKVWIWDHKIVGKIEGKSTRRYETSGQFLGLTHLGWRTYGDRFGGVQVNLLGMAGPTFHRGVIQCAPAMLEAFPMTVARIEAEIAEYEADRSRIRYSPSEFTCMTPYGVCPAIEICRIGT